MDYQIITHKVQLLIQLVDTLTGQPVTEDDVSFFCDHKRIPLLSKGQGLYILLNIDKTEFSFTVKAYGYEKREYQISLEEQEAEPSIFYVYCIPAKNYRGLLQYYTVQGNMPGIQSIDGICLPEKLHREKKTFLVQEYDTRRRILTIFQLHQLSLTWPEYALLYEEENVYEVFGIQKKISNTSYKLKQPLQREATQDLPVVRLVYGMVDQEGNYLIRVPKEQKPDERYLFRYVVNGQEQFRQMDFTEEDKQLGG